jgi:hypothetical protein
VRERRVTRAEVVESDLHAEIPQLPELLEHFGAKIEDRRLGELEVQARRVQAGLLDRLAHEQRQVVLELPRRDVHGDGQLAPRSLRRLAVTVSPGSRLRAPVRPREPRGRSPPQRR